MNKTAIGLVTAELLSIAVPVAEYVHGDAAVAGDLHWCLQSPHDQQDEAASSPQPDPPALAPPSLTPDTPMFVPNRRQPRQRSSAAFWLPPNPLDQWQSVG